MKFERKEKRNVIQKREEDEYEVGSKEVSLGVKREKRHKESRERGTGTEI
jgi:hypothetical protein